MDNYRKILSDLIERDNLRVLQTVSGSGSMISVNGREFVNMSSNDYLGLTGDIDLQRAFLEELLADNRFVMSNASSRLVTGNSGDYDALEAALERLYPTKRALVLGSGYLANTALLPALTQKGDLVLADKLVHASLIDGLRLCECQWARFRHNDMEHLEELLRRWLSHTSCGSSDGFASRGSRVWVVTESIFSMDGDRAPLRELVELKKRYDFSLYVDEAHAFGVHGGGAGLAAEVGVDGAVDVLVGTFGKALASYGAFAAVHPTMREVLVNRARTLIFSTALPPAILAWSRRMVELLPTFESRRTHLRRLSAMLNGAIGTHGTGGVNGAGVVNGLNGANSGSHIIPIVAGANAAALKMAAQMRQAGFWVTAIRHPTVPRGAARVRVSLSAALTEADIQQFVELCRHIG